MHNFHIQPCEKLSAEFMIKFRSIKIHTNKVSFFFCGQKKRESSQIVRTFSGRQYFAKGALKNVTSIKLKTSVGLMRPLSESES